MGMGDVTPTPDQIATFDQALADVENNLDVLIDLWRTGDPDSPEHIRIAGLCVALGDSEWDRIAFVEILVAAIRRLDRAGQAATPDGPRRWALPDELRGDGPCGDCGTYDNIVWFTESVLWNDVVRRDGDDAILCIPCFVIRVDAAGYYPTGWRLLADWHWETKNERARRLTDATPAADGQDGRDG